MEVYVDLAFRIGLLLFAISGLAGIVVAVMLAVHTSNCDHKFNIIKDFRTPENLFFNWLFICRCEKCGKIKKTRF